jgi:hypothetical protein
MYNSSLRIVGMADLAEDIWQCKPDALIFYEMDHIAKGTHLLFRIPVIYLNPEV